MSSCIYKTTLAHITMRRYNKQYTNLPHRCLAWTGRRNLHLCRSNIASLILFSLSALYILGFDKTTSLEDRDATVIIKGGLRYVVDLVDDEDLHDFGAPMLRSVSDNNYGYKNNPLSLFLTVFNNLVNC